MFKTLILRFQMYLGFVFFKGTIFCLLIFSSFVSAQSPKIDLERLQFLPIEGNLSEGTVTSIVQDYRGVLWFGTRFGLNRYNGVDFSTMNMIMMIVPAYPIAI